MRITALVGGQREPVVDIAAQIRPLADWRTLFVDWVELRDPRVAFSATRPQLPGQRAAGLGLAEETGQLLARAAQRLQLDGVSFVAAHYHVAWIARGRFVAVDPVQRGELRALFRHLAARPLLEASTLLAGAGVPVQGGESITWEPVHMVAPLDADLEAWIEAGEPRAAEAEQRLTGRLAP